MHTALHVIGVLPDLENERITRPRLLLMRRWAAQSAITSAGRELGVRPRVPWQQDGRGRATGDYTRGSTGLGGATPLATRPHCVSSQRITVLGDSPPIFP